MKKSKMKKPWTSYYFPTKGSKFHAFRSWLIDKALFFLSARPKFLMPNKILLICDGHLGDVIMSTSIFREIKKVYPESEITVLASKLSLPILEKNPHIDKIITMNVFWQKEHRNMAAFKEYLKLIRQLRKEKYDIGIAVHSNLPNIVTLYLSGIKKRVGYFNLDGGRPFLTNPVPYVTDVHASVMDINLVNQALYMDATDNFPEITFDKEDIMYANVFFNEYDLDKYICIVPGSVCPLQTWDKEKYKAIIEWMLAEHQEYKIVLAGGTADEGLINYLSLDSNKCIKLINHNIRHLGIIFNHADLVLLQDGGPMHLAYTMMKDADRKLFILWGPNPLVHVRPLRGKIIHHPLDCYPCMRQESLCQKPLGQRCMDMINTEEIKQAINEAIK